MLGPDSGIGSARVVVARRAVSLLSNRIFGVTNARLVLRDHLALMDQEHINRILFG